MIKGFAGASIWSEDLNNLLPFYRDILGLKVTDETPGYVIFGETNAPTLALGTHSEVHGKNADPARHMVALLTNDVEAEFQRLKSTGVEFIEEPTNYGRDHHRDVQGPGRELRPALPTRVAPRANSGWAK